MTTVEELIRSWDGETVLMRFDRATDTWMMVCIYSTALGVGTGGTRLEHYSTPADGLADAMRLAQGMARKFALTGLRRGGAKAVLAVPADYVRGRRESLMRSYGRWLATLGGVFETGPDLGTGPSDMAIVAEEYPRVHGLSEEASSIGESGQSTAEGVFVGIRASCRHVFGDDKLEARTVLVHGVGSVGAALVDLLLDAGCAVIVADRDPAAIERLGQRDRLSRVDLDRALSTSCDVFSPCAAGGVINSRTAATLPCRIVAGAANNQLATPTDGETLRARGILYAPDYVINAGAAIFLTAVEAEGWSVERARERVAAIGGTLSDIYRRADELGQRPEVIAEQLVDERLGRHQAV